MSIWVSFSLLIACPGLPGGGFLVLYFHPGTVLAEDGLDLWSLVSFLGFHPICRFVFFPGAKHSHWNSLVLILGRYLDVPHSS